jgi:hypothetical protein
MILVEKIVEFIINFLLTLKSVLKILMSSKFVRVTLPKKESEELVIMGNGPSLKNTIDLHREFLNNKPLMAVNAFATSDEYTLLKPAYYIIVDPQFWIDSPIEGMKTYRDSILNAIIEKTKWPLNLFLPFQAKQNKDFIHRIGSNSLIKPVFFNKTTVKGYKWFSFNCYKFNLGIPRPENILIPSLILGINMGFHTIHLAGADHSWHETITINEDNNLTRKDSHFYDKETPKTHTVKDIFKGRPIYIHNQFESLATVFKIYHVIESYALYRKVRIYNISAKSYIDAFERKKL